MFRVIECIWHQHDGVTLGLAAAIWIVGSLAFLLALERAQDCRAERRASWLALGSVAAGLGVWATHFVAMLAYDGGLPINYALLPTLLSAAISVGGFGLALTLLRRFESWRCALAGTIAALGVGAMHFTGMAAVRTQARISYDWVAVGVSALSAIGLFALAFYLFGRLQGWRRLWVAALSAVLAVFTLHFTGMSATTLHFDPRLPAVVGGQGHEWLVGAIVGSTMAMVGLTALATLIDRHLTDLKGLAAATLEGIVIVRDHRIVEANQRFADLIGHSLQNLIGQDPDLFLAATDGRSITQARGQVTEAFPKIGDPGRVFEVAIHGIEYRGRTCDVFAVRDLTETKAARRQIEHLALHDGLTGLPNRTLLQERLERAISLSARSEEPLALLALDLDRFKAVNDIFGHAEGDRVLKFVADLLRNCVRETDTVARIGGDEFVILQTGVAQPDGARALAHRILETFRAEMNPAMDPCAVGVSVGVAVYPHDSTDAAALHHAADIALYRAKTAGRGIVAFFEAEMDREARERRLLESDLRHAITRNQFHLVYQPLVTTADGKPSGYEALIRWNHPDRGMVPPDDFIPVAEEIGAILQIGEWVLRQACRDAAAWAEPYTLAVNISAVQFQVAALEEIVLSALVEAGLDPGRLELEITETALMKDRAETVRTLHALKARGVRIVMDDFGTGYSSLSNLQSFPFDKIKIDRSFIQSMESDEAARSIIRAIVGIGRSLALPVVAEGVETEAQRRMVQEEGCLQAQGYIFGLPGIGPTKSVVVSSAGHAA